MSQAYENQDAGPNHYQLLGVSRDAPMAAIKKSYRYLSLELHPDKNRASDAADQFNRVKQAFDVLADGAKRKEYNRLGDWGVSTAAQMVIDHKVILMQLVVYYCSSLIFAFLMTFSEPTGTAMEMTVWGLALMLLVEMLLVLQQVPLSAWLLPSTTPHDLVSTLHRIFPAFMNGCRCIAGAFYVDHRLVAVEALDQLATTTKGVTHRCSTALDLCDAILAKHLQQGSEEIGIAERMLQSIRRTVSSSSRSSAGVVHFMDTRGQVIKDPHKLAAYTMKDKDAEGKWDLLLYLAVYLVARYLYYRFKS